MCVLDSQRFKAYWFFSSTA